MDSWLCQPSTLSPKHKTYKQLFQIKLETYCSLTRMVTPHKKLPKLNMAEKQVQTILSILIYENSLSSRTTTTTTTNTVEYQYNEILGTSEINLF